MGNASDAVMDEQEIREQIARCRRIASQTTDDQLRHALERMAEDYEAQLPRCRGSFMLGSMSPGS